MPKRREAIDQWRKFDEAGFSILVQRHRSNSANARCAIVAAVSGVNKNSRASRRR
ncbi:hypothetical protein [Bradyrhizobium sp. Ash2021]|uniref:hypothetical protein n=1 Tax=Bradyrhizobium sp. Ash2021 TaxID=2954771 RepID=UPI002815AA98|nr:hypothetical protein [Bradyrhizobium sp. Ash2021]WMT78853.1 hypothetical protein NL528_22015 [Bradyrhizobium sp. Ash2021]